jgi:dihydropteroate synthase
MSDRLGPLQFGKKQDLIFLGREITEQKDYSERTAEVIDEEVHAIVQGAYDKARRILEDNLDKLHALAGALLEREILDRDEIDAILKGEGGTLPPREPPPTAEPVKAEAAGIPERRGAANPAWDRCCAPHPGRLEEDQMRSSTHWPAREISIFRAGSHEWELGRVTRVLGILNITPDSFSDGGRFTTHEEIERRLWQVAEEGADIIDIGGESTRPGAAPVDVEDEWARIHPALRAARRSNYPRPISVDTTKPEVARRAIDEGAVVISDVSVCSGRPGGTARSSGAGLIVMQAKGDATMQIDHLTIFTRRSIGGIGSTAETAESRDRILRIGDRPKTIDHNLSLLRNASSFAGLGAGILIGSSRKNFIGKLLGDLPAEERVEGSIATFVAAVLAGAHAARVHDVRAAVRAVRIADAIRAEA